MNRSYSVARAQIKIHTYAKGLLSAFAHDLELDVMPTRATAGPLPNGSWSAIIEVPTDELRVVGVIKKGKLHTDVLSPSDRAEIEKRLRNDVFKATKLVMVDVAGNVPPSGVVENGRVSIEMGVDGPKTLADARIKLTSRGEEIDVESSGTFSLKGLGVAEIKGPLGAFALKDEVHFEAMLVLR